MRPILAAVLLLAACGGNKPMTGDDDTPPDANDGPPPAFKVVSNDVMLQPGDEQTFCFYFHTDNTAPVNVNKWVSDLAPGSHHVIFFQNLGNQPADGTEDDCSGGAGGVPVYGTQNAKEEFDFPTDDGTGKPLAQTVAAHTAGYLQLHYINSTEGPLTAHATLEAFALDAGVTFTPTAPYSTYNNDISIPPHGENVVASATCNVPTNSKFWSMSTHSHKQSVATDVKDGSSSIFTSTDWEHPGRTDFPGPQFYTFASGKLTWECTYSNTGDNQNNTVVSGQSARTNEMCMATGYVFPATTTKGCIFNAGQCLCQL